MTGYQWDLAILDAISLWVLVFDWHCFQVMRRWGHDIEEPRWIYFNATTEERRQGDEDHRSTRLRPPISWRQP